MSDYVRSIRMNLAARWGKVGKGQQQSGPDLRVSGLLTLFHFYVLQYLRLDAMYVAVLHTD